MEIQMSGVNEQNIVELANYDIRLVSVLRIMYLEGDVSLDRLRKALDEHHITLKEYAQIVKNDAGR